MNIEERWNIAIARAKIILEQYNNLSNEFTYKSVKDAIEDYLYLADIWKRKIIVVLEWLEELTYDPIKWRDRRLYGPRSGKAGQKVMD